MLNQFRKRLIQTPFDTRYFVYRNNFAIMIVRIVAIAPVVSNNFDKIRTTGTIDGLDRLNCNDKGRGVVSDVSGSDIRIFARVSQTSQT